MSELTKALIKARMACKATLHKEGRNQAQNYAYVGHEHVLTSGAREALLVNGLALVERHVSFAGVLEYATRNGNQVCWRWRGVFDLVHMSGESKEFEFEATTAANDKAAYVASTALDRTAHLRVCCLAGSAEEDPEHDTHDRYAAAASRPAAVSRAVEAAKPRVDEYGIEVPTVACPVVREGKPNAGKRWDELPGGLMQKMHDADMSRMTADQKTWAVYLVAKRAARKAAELAAEQDAAERALAAEGRSPPAPSESGCGADPADVAGAP